MSLIKNETCASCETQCLQCRDPRKTERWSDGSSNPDKGGFSQPKDYPAYEPPMSESIRDFYLQGYHTSLHDDVRYYCAVKLGLVK